METRDKDKNAKKGSRLFKGGKPGKRDDYKDEQQNVPHIEGRSIGGTGGGPGTGDTGGDFDRPGPGVGESQNDWVDKTDLKDSAAKNQQNSIPSDNEFMKGSEQENINPLLESAEQGNDASYYPGSGAVRTKEDKLPAPVKDENAGFSPESPLNKPREGGR